MSARRLAAPAGLARDWDSLQFKTIFALSFAIYLPIAIAWRGCFPPIGEADAPHRSIFADAVAGAGTTAQLAFWG